MFFDRVNYTATQVNDVLFNVTLVTGYNQLPTTATRASLYIKDASGNYAHIDGYRTASQINVNFIYESSETNDTMPTFGSDIEIYSTKGGEILKNEIGIGAIVHIGQSNGMGTEQDSKTALDYVDSRILQWSISNSGLILAEDPLEHYAAPRTNSVGMSMTFAKDLLRYENHKQICIIPYCEGSTGFYEGQWTPGTGYLYNGALANINAFLADNPNNYLIAIIWSLGEDDSPNATRADAFQASFDAATTALRAGIVGNTRMPSASRVPVLATGMSQDWIPVYAPTTETVQAAIEGIGDRLNYAAYVSSENATTQTELFRIHFDTAGYKLIGSRMYAALQTARGNVVAAPATPSGTISVTLNSFTNSGTGSVSNIGVAGSLAETLDPFTSAASATVTQNVTGTIGQTLGAFNSSATGSVASATADVVLLRNTGQTSGATVTWANQGSAGASYDAVQATASEQPVFDASGNVEFDGTDDQLDLPAAVLNNANGYSIMCRFKLTSTTGVMVGGTQDAFYVASGKLRSFSGGSGNLLEGTTTMSTGTWYKAYVAVNGSNNAQEIWLNGTSEGTLTQGAYSTINSFTKIGMFSTSSLPFDGEISHVAIEEDLLTKSQMDDITSSW